MLGMLPASPGAANELAPRGEGVPTAALDAARGHVLVRARGDVPLVVRAPFGFGRVTVVGIDVDRPPLSEWPPLSCTIRRS